MSSSKGNPSNKMPLFRKMDAQLKHQENLVEKVRREEKKTEDNVKRKSKKVLTPTTESVKM